MAQWKSGINMIFPIFTVQQFVDENGYLMPDMQDYFDLQAQALQNGLSDNGWTVPQITAADLATIAPEMPNGTIWYESDAKVWVGRQDNGSGGFNLVKFTTTPYP